MPKGLAGSLGQVRDGFFSVLYIVSRKNNISNGVFLSISNSPFFVSVSLQFLYTLVDFDLIQTDEPYKKINLGHDDVRRAGTANYARSGSQSPFIR